MLKFRYMSRMYEYKVEYEVDKETGQVTATIPELNNISTYGDTFAEAEMYIKEAALGYFEFMAKLKQKIPKPVAVKEGTCLKLLIPKLT